MILSLLLDAIYGLFELLLSWVNIPSMGEEFDNAVAFIDTLFSNAQELINLFLPWDIVRFGVPLIILVCNFEHLYHFIMWILRKIPALGIE